MIINDNIKVLHLKRIIMRLVQIMCRELQKIGKSISRLKTSFPKKSHICERQSINEKPKQQKFNTESKNNYKDELSILIGNETDTCKRDQKEKEIIKGIYNTWQSNYLLNMQKVQKISFITILLFIICLNGVNCTFTPFNTTSNIYTNYSLEINSDASANSGAVVLITFPQQYSPQDLYKDQPYSGAAGYCLSDCSAVRVQYFAYTIVLENMFPSSAQIFFMYTINNIRNPSYAVTTSNFIIQVKSADLLTTYYSQTAQLQFAAPNFTTLTLTLDNPYLWQVSDLNVDVSVTPDTESLSIVFPTKWENETLIDSAILSTGVVITSSTHAISFTRSLQTFNIQFPPITTNQTLKLTFKSIYTPSSVINVGSITFYAYDSSNNIIMQSTAFIFNSQLKFDYPRQTQATIIYDSVNNKVTIKNTFQFPRNALKNDKILIVYPSQIVISTVTSNYQVFIAGSLIPNVVTVFPNNSIAILPFTTSYFQPTLQVDMIIQWPRTVVSTSNFSIQSFRLIGSTYVSLQNTQCCSLWIKEKPTLIASLGVTNNQRLKANVQYTFNLTHSFTILTGTDFVVIQFPTVFQLSSSNQSSVCSSAIAQLPSNSSNINPSLICTLSSNILSFSNLFIGSQSPSLLSLTINLTNPSQSSNENFQIWSQDSLGQKIESNEGLNLTVTPASLNSVMVIPGSFITNDQTSYSINVSASGTITKNSIIKVIFPQQIGVMGSYVICKINSTQQYCSMYQANRAISVLVSSDLASTTFSVNINNLINPDTFSTSSNFGVEIYDPFGSLVESSSSLSTGLSVQMTQLGGFLYNKMWTDSVSLNQMGNLKFLIVTQNCLQMGTNYRFDITLSLRNTFNINDTLSILIFNGNTTSFSLSNTTSSTQISIQFTPSVYTNTFTFQFSQITVFKATLTVSATLSKQISSVFYQSAQTVSPLFLDNSLNAILISNYQVTQDNYFLNESPGTLVFQINTIPNDISFVYIKINIPKNYQSVSGTYQYVTSSNSTTLSFTISDLLNPVSVTFQPFTFIIYDSTNTIVGISQPSNQYFQTKCTPPCRDCKSATQKTLCVDCYQIPENKLIYFRETTIPYGTCVDHCVSGEYLNATLMKCMSCSSNCSSCMISISGGSGDPQKCLTCSLGNMLLNFRCYSTCPTGYYPNNLVCSQCLPNCNNCTSLSICTQCTAGYSLFLSGKIQVNTGQQCVSTCPLGTVEVLMNSTVTVCSNCPANCLDCSSVSICTLCLSGYYLYNGVCYVTCPLIGTLQLYPNKNSTCTYCECLTCTQYSYKCLSCTIGMIYSPSDFQCKTKCDDGYYKNTNTCLQCPTTCLKCINSSFCTLCKETYILYSMNSSNSQCLSQCPNGTISTISSPSQIFECLPCSNGCISCSLSPAFCTQCQNGYVFFNNLCEIQCPAGYHNISGFCKVCADECQRCDANDPRSCTQCSVGYFLNNNFCYANCPQGTYIQASIKKCLSCQALCETCMNANNCTSCKAGYYLFPNNLCYTSCPTTPIYYYAYNSQCMLCQPQCTSCLSSPVECSSCSSPYFYQNEDTKQCSTTCAHGYFIKDTMCVKCQLPCLTCDGTYNSCLSCYSNSTLKYVYEGSCFQSCPQGYYGDTFQNSTITIQNKCTPCPFPCITCSSTQCFQCESFAFMYKETCIMDCSATSDMPFSKENYCTNCIQVAFCSICNKSESEKFVCWQCTFPYVLFQGQCLDQCPLNFKVSSDTNRTCVQTETAQLQRQESQSANRPSIPFPFIISFALVSLILYPLSKHFYEFTYHVGYLIFLTTLLDHVLVYNWLINYQKKYQGEYNGNDQQFLPLIIILVALIIRLVGLGWVGFGYVIKCLYLQDVRYLEWKTQCKKTFILSVVLVAFLGSKTHKLFYSKLFGLPNFSYRIVSVEKFFLEDRINFLTLFTDLLLLSGFVIVAFNVFIEQSVLYMTSIQIIILKQIEWTFLLYDSKKPDRGFFYGDQKIALQEIQKEEEEQLTHLRRIDTDHLIKMIRRKSAGHLSYDNQPFGQIEKAQFLSVYNPEDYEDVPKVPLLKIQQNIKKGRFRKGRKITIEQKLQRFADSIKPKPKISDKQEYIHGLIYWKPPKKIKITKQQKIEPVSEESMLKILEDKEMEYKEELQEIENIVFQEKQTIQTVQTNRHNFRTGQFFFKSNDLMKVDSYNFLDSSNPSIQELEFEDLSTFKPPNEEIEYDDLLNRNYARKKHLPQIDNKLQFDENSMRILHHQPKKRRIKK